MALRPARFRVPAFLILAVTSAALAFGEPGRAAAADCRQQVIADWSADGRVDRVYPLDCYQQAVESLAPDIRDYTDAQESIERALVQAMRAKGKRGRTQAPARSLAAAESVEPGDSPPIGCRSSCSAQSVERR